jgi:hypothetical protein
MLKCLACIVTYTTISFLDEMRWDEMADCHGTALVWLPTVSISQSCQMLGGGRQ